MSKAREFPYDVFLSHNAQDKPRVRRLAERLKQAGLRVWFDEWNVRSGDIIALKVDEGLEQSRVLLLCISPSAVASGWVALEQSTAIYRDPANKGRRFIPLLLADCELPDTLGRYKCVDFREEADAAFAEVLAVCRLESAEVSDGTPEPEKKRPKSPQHVLRDRVFLNANRRRIGTGWGIHASVLSADGRHFMVQDQQVLDERKLECILAEFESGGLGNIAEVGRKLTKLVLPNAVASALGSLRKTHLVVVEDPFSFNIPWEVMNFDGWFPAQETGLSRLYVPDAVHLHRWIEGESARQAAWLQSRTKNSGINVLLVTNPTQDLSGAEEEEKRIQSILSTMRGIELQSLRGPFANKGAILDILSAGRCDIVHYAGHVMLDDRAQSRSGIVCSQGEILNCSDLIHLRHLPGLFCLFSCEAGRIGSGRGRRSALLSSQIRMQTRNALGQSLLNAGVPNYLGTTWPASAVSAHLFASAFYGSLLKGASITQALANARRDIRCGGSTDWAALAHYSAFDLCVKTQ